jgi:GntR family transcriptional regulator, transcriptional repressor for pyruvate dehydrogenase complex
LPLQSLSILGAVLILMRGQVLLGFDPIRKSTNLTGGLVETLAAQIEAGELTPGQRLPTEQAIVDATGVSRTVVREALASLRAKGLITTRQGLGAFVAERPPKAFAVNADEMNSISEVLRLLELRMSVEVEAAAFSAERRTTADIERMTSRLRAFDKAIGSGGRDAEEDFAFHRDILASTQNSYFTRIFDVFGSLIIPRQRIRLEAMPAEERAAYLNGIQREHRAILKAIKLRDKDAAREAARHHLLNAYERYRNLVPRQAADARRPGKGVLASKDRRR